MALTANEAQELQSLEQEELQAQQLLQPGGLIQPQGLTPEEEVELQALEQEELQAQEITNNKPQLKISEKEADLGISLRLRYSVESIESNRRALLVKELGAENVLENEKGEVQIIQDGEIRPVNAPGPSVADVADFFGSTPEMVGTTIGAALGSVPTLGFPGPGTFAGAAFGGAVGSLGRQGLSALFGTPQVATFGERAVETGLSGLFSGVAGVAGQKIKGFVKKLFPRFKIDKSLKKIAKELDIPEPTVGQLAGGRDLALEKQLAETPLFGRGIRKKMEAQVKAIKRNLAEKFGDFSDVDLDRAGLGGEIKNRVTVNVKAIKEAASNLFDEVAEKGVDAEMRAVDFSKSIKENFKKLGLVNSKGKAASFSTRTGLTREQFKRLQGIAIDILDDVKSISKDTGGLINANDVNLIRKSIDANIKEGPKFGFDDSKLVDIREAFLDVTEGLLGDKSPDLKRNFKEARALWGSYLKNKSIAKKLGLEAGLEGVSDEKVLTKIFFDKKSVEQFKLIVDKKTLKNSADSFISDLLSKKIGKEGQISARGALTAIRNRREALKLAFGDKSYDVLIKNLEFLDIIGESINPSGTAITGLRTAVLKGVGLSVVRATRKKIARTVEDLPKTAAKGIGLITDPIQRATAFEGANRE